MIQLSFTGLVALPRGCTTHLRLGIRVERRTLRFDQGEVLLESLSKRSLFLSHRWEPEVNISHARTLVVRGSKTSLNEAPYCMLTAAQVSISVDVVL